MEEAFANAAYGMFAVMTDLRKVREIDSRHFSLKAGDMESLLFEWLNHLLYILDVEHLLFKKFEVKIDKLSLTATYSGEKFDPERHKILIGVKSATYYLLEVTKAKRRVRVIFDV
jgi:SHS2 domain-containing protein